MTEQQMLNNIQDAILRNDKKQINAYINGLRIYGFFARLGLLFQYGEKRKQTKELLSTIAEINIIAKQRGI